MKILKKNLALKISRSPEKELYFFDEARFGTHSKRGYGWFRKGSRTSIQSKLGFKNFYLFSAINVRNGEDFSLIIPNTNTECMNIFLQEMSKYLCERSAYVVMDNAGWHCANDLRIPSNIELVRLPPYSPELNPVERFWRYVKNNTIKNRIFATLHELELALCAFLNNTSQQTKKSICSLNYLST